MREELIEQLTVAGNRDSGRATNGSIAAQMSVVTAQIDAAYKQGFHDGVESTRQKLSGKYGTA